MRFFAALLVVAGLIIVTVRAVPSEEFRFPSGLRVSDDIPPEEMPEVVARMSAREFADWARSHNEAQYAAAQRHAAYLAERGPSRRPMWSSRRSSRAMAATAGTVAAMVATVGSAVATADSVLGSADSVASGLASAGSVDSALGSVAFGGLGLGSADSALGSVASVDLGLGSADSGLGSVDSGLGSVDSAAVWAARSKPVAIRLRSPIGTTRGAEPSR